MCAKNSTIESANCLKCSASKVLLFLCGEGGVSSKNSSNVWAPVPIWRRKTGTLRRSPSDLLSCNSGILHRKHKCSASRCILIQCIVPKIFWFHTRPFCCFPLLRKIFVLSASGKKCCCETEVSCSHRADISKKNTPCIRVSVVVPSQKCTKDLMQYPVCSHCGCAQIALAGCAKTF